MCIFAIKQRALLSLICSITFVMFVRSVSEERRRGCLDCYCCLQAKLNVNYYATKKTISQGMLDIALLTANAAQLKYILQVVDNNCQQPVTMRNNNLLFPATTFFCYRMSFCCFCNRCHFSSCNKSFMKFFLLIIACCHTQILNLRAKINFANMFKIIRKLGKLRA